MCIINLDIFKPNQNKTLFNSLTNKNIPIMGVSSKNKKISI